MKKNFKNNFILCGFCGWCIECFFTGLHSFLCHDKSLACHTSIWMFPIYGLAALLEPLSRLLRKQCLLVRGSIYTICIYLTEFLTGFVLKKYNACPWDYSSAKLNYKGIIRLDFAPLWFLTGLLFEKILKKTFYRF